MEKINAYFLKAYKNNSFIDQQRAKALLVIGLFASVFIIIVTLFSHFNQVDNKSFAEHVTIPFLIVALIQVILYLLKLGKLNFAGNLLVTGVLLLQILSLFQRIYSVPIYVNFFAGTYYYLLLILVMGLLFSTKLNLLLNAALVVISTLYVFILDRFTTDEHLHALLKIAMTDYLVATTLLVIIIWYSKQINIKSSTLIADEIKSKMLQNEAMMNMLNKTQQSSVKLFQSSSELSHLASIISQNANEQSATSEEIASSMEEMLNTIVSTTENAEYTKKITTQTANETELSRGILERTIKAVNKISGKISIISEISGKTDLLSINAAIEASRAGDSGRGFAVVAQEIRKLADKTKLASAEIESLAHDGQEISKNAGEKLAKLLPEIIKSAQLVENIVHMSREQQAGVENINQSIQQLSQITVNNADASEKMANAAKDLAQQAELLKNLTAYMQADNTLTGGS